MNLDLTNRRTLINSLPSTFTHGAEVGVRTGWFARYILKNTKFHKLYCIDPWIKNPQLLEKCEEAENMFKLLTKSYFDRVVALKDWSPQVAYKFDNDSLDFVYIDAEHTYEAVKLDLRAWWPKVKKGGILAGHDYGWESVKKAVDEFANEYSVVIKQTGIVNNAFSSLTGSVDEYDGDQPSWVIIKDDINNKES